MWKMNSPVIVSSVYFDIMFVPIWVWVLSLWQHCADCLSVTWNPMTTGSGSQQSSKLQRNVPLWWNFVILTHAGLGGSKIFNQPQKSRSPRLDFCGSLVSGRDSCATLIMYLIFSRIVRFILSATPLCCGVPGTVLSCRIPCFEQ